MIASYNPATNTLTVVFTDLEEKTLAWVRKNYGAQVILDVISDFISRKHLERTGIAQDQVAQLISTDQEVINLLRSKGVDI